MIEKTYTTRGGSAAFLLGNGPLTKTFKLFQVEDRQYLVWSHDLRYRMDHDEETKLPVLTPFDILEN